MLSVLWGPGFATKQKLELLLERLALDKDSLFRIKNDSEEKLSDFLSGGLFGGRVYLVGEFLLESPYYEQDIKELLGSLASSEHLIFLREKKLSEKWQEIFRNAGAEVKECKNPSGENLLRFSQKEAAKLGLVLSQSELHAVIEEQGGDPEAIFERLARLDLEQDKIGARKNFSLPNFFTFADNVTSKNTYGALKLLRSYVQDGVNPEEAFWKLWWKVKTLRMVDSKARVTLLHPFVQKKAFQDLKNYSTAELRDLSYGLMDLFSEVRRGEENFEEGLEKILLRTSSF